MGLSKHVIETKHAASSLTKEKLRLASSLNLEPRLQEQETIKNNTTTTKNKLRKTNVKNEILIHRRSDSVCLSQKNKKKQKKFKKSKYGLSSNDPLMTPRLQNNYTIYTKRSCIPTRFLASQLSAGKPHYFN